MRGAYPSGCASTLARQMEQPTLIPTKCFVRDLADGQEVDSIFVVRARNRRQKRNGEPFLKLQLGDATGSVEAVVWDGVDELDQLCDGGAIVRVLGRYSVDERYGRGITIRRMRAAAGGRVRAGRPRRGAADPLQPDGRRPRSRWWRRSSARTCASCSTA